MPNLNHEQLQQWYANLKTILYEQANVDLTRKEDLGRIRILRINDLHHEDPDTMPDVDMIYPFIPHRALRPEEQSADPLLSYYCYDPPAPNKADTEAYHKWLLDSVTNAPITDKLIQELYDMSAEGQLMVVDGTSEPGMHQIYTQNGQITLSATHDKARFEEDPLPVAPPKDESPDLPEKPAEPPRPGDPPKGFWIRVGHFFGISTKYTEYVNKKEAYDQYLKAVENWEKVCEERTAEWEAQQDEATYQRRMESLQQQTEAFNQYIQAFDNYFKNPLSRFDVAFRFSMEKLRVRDNEEGTMWQQRVAEDMFWDELHQNTLLGMLQTDKDKTSDAYKGLGNVREAVETVFGPKYKQVNPLVLDGIIQAQSGMTPYAVPVTQDIKISDKDAAWICQAFLADPAVLGQDLAEGQLEGLDEQERYQKIMDALLLKGEEDSDPLFAYVREARTAGANAMKEYALGNSEPLAMALAQCIRRQNMLAPYQTDPYALKSFGITTALLEILDKNPTLMEESKLTADELQQARAMATVYHVNAAGLRAKANLLGHALNQKNLSQEELRSAAADLLLMSLVNAQVEQKQDILLTPEQMQQTRQNLMQHEAVTQLLNLDRTELGKATVIPQALFAKMPQLHPEAQKAPGKEAEVQPMEKNMLQM